MSRATHATRDPHARAAAARQARTHLLYPLDVVYGRAGISPPPARAITARQLPHTYRDLLDHEEDMTLTLERRYHDRLLLRALSRFGLGRSYFRRVLLAQAHTGRPVVMGAIRLRLDLFPRLVRRRILESQVPLGRILHEARWAHRSRPFCFLSITPNSDIMGVFWMRRPRTLYGRRTEIFHEGVKFGDIIEVLPPA